MQSALDNMKEYGDTWGLQFNGVKSAAMVIYPDFSPPDPVELTIGFDKIPYVHEHKTLGIWLDDRLSWNKHVSHLASSASRAVGLLRLLAKRFQGATRDSLLHIYKTLCRSRLEYGATLLLHAAPTVLKKLDSVQNKALRVILGVPISTSIAAMEVEANVPPLHLRRQFLRAKLYVRSTYYRGAFAHCINHAPRYRSMSSRPHGKRAMTALLQDFDSLGAVTSTIPAPPPLPPWQPPILPPNLLTIPNWLAVSRTGISPVELSDRFYAYLFTLPQHDCVIFTDGSRTLFPQTCGYGLYEPATTASDMGRLPNHFSILTAELQSIRRAIQYASLRRSCSLLVISDSQTAIRSLSNPASEHPFVPDIHALCADFSAVTILWVPSHCNIAGNTQADLLAKQSLASPTILPFSSPYSDTLHSLRVGLHKKWSASWTAHPHGRLLFSVKPVPTNWAHVGRNPRLVDRLMGRLRCRRANTADFLHMVDATVSPYCPHCHQLGSVPHLLLECPSFAVQRSILSLRLRDLNLPFSLKTLLGGTSTSSHNHLQIHNLLLDFLNYAVGLHTLL